MTSNVRDDVHSPRTPRIPHDHSRHDRLLVARFAADDSYPTEAADAEALVAGCRACASLTADVRLLRVAMADLPAPRRRRDFRLSAEQADELKGTPLTRLFRRLAAPGIVPLRPVAGVALSLGIALAVVGTALPTPDAFEENAAFPMPAEERAGDAATEYAPGAQLPGDAPAAGEQPGSIAGGEGATDDGDFSTMSQEASSEPGLARELLIYAGLLIALLSFAVLMIVSFARRRWRDPLLR